MKVSETHQFGFAAFVHSEMNLGVLYYQSMAGRFELAAYLSNLHE